MERDQALDVAIGQIEKNFGKGSIMRMGDRPDMEIETVSTGALSLDIALGVGGLPRGRIVEIYGPEASGKCLTADTHVWTDRGLETVAELFARCGQAASCTSRVTAIRHHSVRAVNERGELEEVVALTHNNRRPVLRLKLQSGREVKVTANHPLRVVNERGFIVWREAGRIREGDVVVSALFGAVEASSGDGLSEDEAVLLGYLVAEGTLGGTTQFRFTNYDREVGAEFTKLVEQLFGATVKLYGEGDYAVHSKALRTQLAEQYGLDYVNAPGKTVPSCIRTGGHKIQRAFLSALFEGDGWIDDSSTVGLGTASEQLAHEVQLLLYGLGIPCTVRPTYNEKYERDYWSVTVNPAAAHRFLEEVGFRSQRRQAQVAAHFRRSSYEPRFENVPLIKGLVCDLRDDIGGDREFDRIAGDLFRTDFDLECSRSRLEGIVAWADARRERMSGSGRAVVEYLRYLSQARYTYEAVVSVEDAGVQPTFDVVLPKTHSFLANGIVSHNTTLAMHVVAEAQRNGGICAYVDAEHAVDPVYARAIGVNVDDLLISQPDTGEQALEIADTLIRSGALDVVVIDSVAALTPRAEIEGEMGDTHVGLQARLMSQALRKLTANLNRTNTIAIFINQLREKIGVMFGCFSGDSLVTLADGTQERIGKIVSQRLPVEVLSYDPELNAVVPKKVVNWFDNGLTSEFLHLAVSRAGGNGRAQFSCTANHQIRTPAGWREAGELAVGDRVLQAVPHRLSSLQWQVLLGALMGDGALSPTRNGSAARLRWGHGKRQVEYGDWKASLFANIGVSRSTNSKGAVFHDVQPLPELAELRDAVYVSGQKTLSEDYLKQLTPLSLAIWYMDDGSFALRAKGLQERTKDGSGRAEICVEAFDAGSRERLVDYLRDTWGINAKLNLRGARRIAYLTFPKDETAKLHALVAQFIHPSMEYKLLPRFGGRFKVEPVFAPMRHELMPMPIVEIRPKVMNFTGPTHRFDIEVEGSHNYFVDGVMVHNSPETTPGGRALKFYSSVRLDIRRIEAIKDGVEVVGNRTRVKVVKNKVASPFRQAEFDITYGKGISREGSLIDVGVDRGIVKKSGAWFTYEGEQLGQGRENAKAFLAENLEIMVEISERILQDVGLAPPVEGAEPAKDGADSDDEPISLD